MDDLPKISLLVADGARFHNKAVRLWDHSLIDVLFCLQKQDWLIWKIQNLYDSVSVIGLDYGV